MRTKGAWYVLDKPAPVYRPFLEVIYTPHLLTCALSQNGRISLSSKAVKRVLEAKNKAFVLQYAKRILGRELGFGDFVAAVRSLVCAARKFADLPTESGNSGEFSERREGRMYVF